MTESSANATRPQVTRVLVLYNRGEEIEPHTEEGEEGGASDAAAGSEAVAPGGAGATAHEATDDAPADDDRAETLRGKLPGREARASGAAHKPGAQARAGAGAGGDALEGSASAAFPPERADLDAEERGKGALEGEDEEEDDGEEDVGEEDVGEEDGEEEDDEEEDGEEEDDEEEDGEEEDDEEEDDEEEDGEEDDGEEDDGEEDDEELDPSMEGQAEMVARALSREGYRTATADIEDEVDRILDAIVLERPAVVFNLVDQFYGDGTQHAAVAALLDLLAVPYTGADPLALGTCQDRARTHLILEDAAVPVPGYAIVRDVNAIPDTANLRAPLIVTQAFDDCYDEEGAARPVETREALEERIYELAREYDLPLLVEEYLGGRRLHAVVVGGRVLDVLPLTETEWDEDGEAWVALARLDAATADRARALAQRAFRATGCRDFAQVDLHARGEELAVTDVRPAVDLGPHAPIRVAATAREGGFDGIAREIVRAALDRTRALEESDAAGQGQGSGSGQSAGSDSRAAGTGALSSDDLPDRPN